MLVELISGSACIEAMPSLILCSIFQDVKLQAAEQERHRTVHTVRQYVIHNDVEENKEDIERDG